MSRIFLVTLLLAISLGCAETDAPSPPVQPPEDSTQTPSDLSSVLEFNFDENDLNLTYESITQTPLNRTDGPISRSKITGVSRTAARTFSYFGWFSGNINVSLPTDGITVTGWIAPATYPVQRKDQDPINEETIAAIFTNQNYENTKGASLGINHLGKAIGRIVVGNQVINITSYDAIPLDEWTHLALSVDAQSGIIDLYINGVKDRSNTFTSGSINWNSINEVILGRGSKIKTLAGFNTNGLQGAIDEVIVWNRAMNTDEVLSNFESYSAGTPDLSINISTEYSNNYNRPIYHLTPSFGWTNEPHGLFYLDNTYHIFNQSNENGPYWSHINWGHYTSTDLIHWEDQGQVLFPEPGFDEVGIWSGHVAIKDNEPYLFYTGVDKAKAAIGLANSNPPYSNWTKAPGNPIISQVPASPANADFRDPFVFEHDNQWFMMIGTGIRDGNSRGGLFLYRANDQQLRSWSLVGDYLAYQGNTDAGDVGTYWEMPIYHDFGDDAFLLVNRLKENSRARAMYWSGNFDGVLFNPVDEAPKFLELTDNLLAPTIALDEQQRLIAIGIIPDEIDSGSHRSQGWAHSFSLPRVWTLDNGQILQIPHPQIEILKGDLLLERQNVSVRPGSQGNMNNINANHYKIEASFDMSSANQAGFVLHRNGSEQTKIYYDRRSQQLTVDRTNSSSLGGVERTKILQRSDVSLPDQQNWEIFVDASVIEVFINQSKAFSSRVFPSTQQREMDIMVQGGDVQFSSIRVFDMSGEQSSKKLKNTFSLTTGKNALKITAKENFDKNIPLVFLDASGQIIEELIFPKNTNEVSFSRPLSMGKIFLMYRLNDQIVIKPIQF